MQPKAKRRLLETVRRVGVVQKFLRSWEEAASARREGLFSDIFSSRMLETVWRVAANGIDSCSKVQGSGEGRAFKVAFRSSLVRAYLEDPLCRHCQQALCSARGDHLRGEI